MYTLWTSLHIYNKKFTVGIYYLVNIHYFPVKESTSPQYMFGLSWTEK